MAPSPAHVRAVRTFNTSTAKLPADVEDLPAGIYFVRCTSPHGVRTARFLKE